MIKEAAKNLLDRNEITVEEYNFIEQNEFEVAKNLEKIAGSKWDFLRNGLLGLSLGTGLAYAGTEIADRVSKPFAIRNSFDQMKNKVPILKDYPEDQIKDYFDVVKTFSPRAASNPLVAGALVHKMLEFGGVDHKLVQDIAQIESAKPSGFIYDVSKSAFGEVAKPHKSLMEAKPSDE